MQRSQVPDLGALIILLEEEKVKHYTIVMSTFDLSPLHSNDFIPSIVIPKPVSLVSTLTSGRDSLIADSP